jgi:geranylgeranyl diphosphate synthase, type I
MIKNYLEQIPEIKKQIDLASVKFILEKKSEYYYDRNTKDKVFDRLAEFITRGKCIRGTLFYYIANELGCRNKKDLLDFAVGIELIHAALLIHDDIMDNDILRRGKPSMYAQYINEVSGSKRELAIETAKSIAISIGDMAIFMAFGIFSRALKNNPNKIEIMSLLVKDYSRTGLGQIDDVFFSGSDFEPTPKEITRVFLYKTARYTFSAPLALAALFAGKSKNLISSLDKIGENMGIVFQMRDDEIGFWGNQTEIGKTIGIDITKNNKNLIRYYLYKNSSEKDKSKLDKIFGKTNIKSKDLEVLRSIALSNGTTAKIQKLKEKYIDFAKNDIDKIKYKNIKISLNDLLIYLNNRKS